VSGPSVTIEAEFGGKGSFVDLTARTRSFTISRGRTDYTQPFRAGIANLVMSNLDGELDPDNAGGTYFGEILVGRLIKITSNSSSMLYARQVYEGVISDYELSYEIAGDAIVTITCVDRLADLAQQEIPDATAVSAESTGDRVDFILNLPEVDYQGTTNISTGQSTCAAGTASGNALAYLEQIVTTEQGALYVTRTGVLRFLDRYELLNAATLTFSDDGSDTNYESIERLVTQLELYNSLAANRAGQIDVVRDNATNQSIYGVRFLDLGEVLFDTDAEVTDMLDFALVRFTSTSPRIAEVTTLLDSKSQIAVSQLVQLDLADSVTVEFTPPGVSQIVVPCSIESIAHAYTVGQGWRLSFGFTPRDTSSYFVLDDAVLGKLDENALAF
jgi:hypothetical protein